MKKSLYPIGKAISTSLTMDILFSSKKMGKILNSEKEIRKSYGKELGKKIQLRLAVLRAAPTLHDVSHLPPERRHELMGDRKGQFAVNLLGGDRLIFVPHHDPLPKLADGGVDLKKVTVIKILEVENYH